MSILKSKLFINQDLIIEKISDIEKALKLVDTIVAVPEESFLNDQILSSAAKYQLVLAIEAAQNICNHLAARVAKEAPISYADCYRILEQSKMISKELSEKLVSMAKFRNLLVHQYGKVDDNVVYSIIRNDIQDLVKYIVEIKTFLKAVNG